MVGRRGGISIGGLRVAARIRALVVGMWDGGWVFGLSQWVSREPVWVPVDDTKRISNLTAPKVSRTSQSSHPHLTNIYMHNRHQARTNAGHQQEKNNLIRAKLKQ